ncbi:MAG: penicillin-binding protein 2 [Acidimicrobiales bacterium]
MSPAVLLSRRTRAMRLLLTMVFLVMVVRLVQVQEFGHRHYAALSRAQLTHVVVVPPLRGGIYDRNGEILAETVTRQTVVADPQIITDPTAVAAVLSPLLGIPTSTLRAQLTEPTGYVPLAHRVPDAVASTIAKLMINGIDLIPESQRVVPSGLLAHPVVGNVDWEGNGVSGLEYQYQSTLAGKPGSTESTDASSGSSATTKTTPAEPGTGLELTLDQSVQYVAEQALASEIVAAHASGGMAIIMNVASGDIIASANLTAATDAAVTPTPTATTAPATSTTTTTPTSAGTPTLTAKLSPQPNTSGSQLIGQSNTLPPGISQASSNSSVTQVYEPGSVFKLVTFSAALAAGVISPTTVLSVPPSLPMGKYTFSDAEPHGTVSMTATQVLAESSNIGTIEIAQGLGRTRLLNQISNLGFGHKTGLGIPGESQGLIPGPRQWTGTSIGSTPIGQGDAVTAQQVLDAYNAVANGGVFVSPRLVRGMVGPGGKMRAAAASPTRRVIDAKTNAALTTMLESVVAAGTGVSAAVDGYAVAGKTGTAQVPSPDHLGYIPGHYIGSFAGFAPAQHPVLSAIVVLNHPTPIYGGAVAAPVFSTIMAYALHHFGIPTTAAATAATAAASTTAVGGTGSVSVPARAVTEGP